MTTSTTWQLGLDSARRYEEVLVATILGPFARDLVTAAAPIPGDAVVDVGCGTGAAARRAAELAGARGSVVGVDVNPAMLHVASALPAPAGAPIAWREAAAEDLPLPDASSDVVVCAQSLQFVRDRVRALREMRRIARPGARIALGVWRALDENPYFAAVSESLARHLGRDVAAGLLAAFSLSEDAALRRAIAEAGLPEPTLSVHEVVLALPAPEAFVPRHLSATPMAPRFAEASPARRERVVADVSDRLGAFAQGEGLRVPFRSWFVQLSLGERA